MNLEISASPPNFGQECATCFVLCALDCRDLELAEAMMGCLAPSADEGPGEKSGEGEVVVSVLLKGQLGKRTGQ